MRAFVPLFAALGVLAGSVAAGAQNRSACRQALQALSNAASSASAEATRMETECRGADTSCDRYRSCRVVPGPQVSSECQSQQIACESGRRRCSAAQTSLDRALGAVQSGYSSVQLSCR
ncbi:MAG TPA: hypothetical protein VFY49_08685 [Myxococcota bacterium]|nr:hypothetical protein [Myxococcota bacterium]